jgi:hypothetical protein
MKPHNRILVLISAFLLMFVVLSSACSIPVLDQIQQAKNSLPTGEALLKTAQYALSAAPELLQTAQGLATYVPPGFEKTLAVMVTEGSANLGGSVPEDIPIVEPRNEDLLVTTGSISYTTSKSFADVVKFYKESMLTQQWTFNAKRSVETDATSVLQYEKADRIAIVNITRQSGKVIIVIALLAK